MKERYDADEYNMQTESITESTRTKICTKVVLTLLKDLSRESFKNLILGEKSTRMKKLAQVIQQYLDVQPDKGSEDIKHTQERSDGSSDRLYEALDITRPDGTIECSNWNYNLQQKGTVEQLYPEIIALTPDDEMKLFTRIQETLFPEKNNLTGKDQTEVYNKMEELLEEINNLISDLI